MNETNKEFLDEMKRAYNRDRYTELAEYHYDNIWRLIEMAEKSLKKKYVK